MASMATFGLKPSIFGRHATGRFLQFIQDVDEVLPQAKLPGQANPGCDPHLFIYGREQGIKSGAFASIGGTGWNTTAEQEAGVLRILHLCRHRLILRSNPEKEQI